MRSALRPCDTIRSGLRRILRLRIRLLVEVQPHLASRQVHRGTEEDDHGERHRDVALYDLGYRIEEGGLLDGDEVRLRGLARIDGVAPGQAQARLDALWRERNPSEP